MIAGRRRAEHDIGGRIGVPEAHRVADLVANGAGANAGGAVAAAGRRRRHEELDHAVEQRIATEPAKAVDRRRVEKLKI